MSNNRLAVTITGDSRGLQQAAQQATAALDGVSQAAARPASGINSLTSALGQMGRTAGESAQGAMELGNNLMGIVRGGLVAGGVLAIASALRGVSMALYEASAAGQRLTTQLNFATNGNGVKEMAFVADMAKRLGLDLNSTAKAYAGFQSAARGTALQGRKAAEVFESIASASSVMGLSVEETQGALLAVQQMLSKGKVSAEEFRGQLGERMPIALEAGAKALGVTREAFIEMMESGKIVSEDFLPKFAAAMKEMLGDSAAGAASSLTGRLNNLNTAWEKLKRTMGDAGAASATGSVLGALENGLTAVGEAFDKAKANGSGTFMQWAAGLTTLLARTTPLRLLPIEFRTLNEQVEAATATIKRLDEQEAKNGKLSIYSMSERAAAARDLAEANKALAASGRLQGGATAQGIAANGQGREEVEARLAKQKADRAAALKAAMVKYATKDEKLKTELDNLREQLGGAIPADLEARIRKQFADPIRAGVKSAAEKVAEEARKNQAEWDREYAASQKRRYEEIVRTYDAEVAAYDRSAKAAADKVQQFKDEEDAAAMAAAQNIDLSKAIELVAVSRLREAQAAAVAAGEQEKVDAIQREIDARTKLAEVMGAKASQKGALDAAQGLLKTDVGTDFAAGFDAASQSLGVFVQQFGKLVKLQDDYTEAKKADGLTSKQRADIDAAYASKQISGYAAMAGAAKGFFRQKTAGYKAMQTAEQVLRAVELASSAQRITAKLAEGQAVAAVGVANQASGDPYSAPFRMAAMAAAMAALGFVVAGGGGGGSSSPPPSNRGTGTVLGDKDAASESVSKAIENLTDVDAMTMRYSAAMAASLRNIEGGIGGLASLLVQSGGLDSAAAGVQEGFKRDAIGKVLYGPLGGILNPVGQLLGGLFGTKTKIVGQGIVGGPQSVGSILSGGFDASYFVDVNKKKKAFGVTYSDKTKTQYSNADPQLERQIGSIFSGFSQALAAASGPLGRNLEQVKGAIDGFVVDIGRVDLKGLTGEQISERLTNVFSAAGDRLAGAALGGLEAFQKVGEGYLQTVVRTASGVETATVVLRGLGRETLDYTTIVNKQGDVAAELVRDSLLATEAVGGVADVLRMMSGSAAEVAQAYKSLTDARLSMKLLGLDASALGYELIQGAGGIENLTSSLSAFEEGFTSKGAQLDARAARMADAFGKLGLALPTSSDGFVSLVRGIDTSTESGRILLGNVLQLSSGFAGLLDAIKNMGAGIQAEIERIRGLSRDSSQASLAQLQSEFAIKTAQARAGDQAAIDALPAVSQALLKAAEAMSGTRLEMLVAQAQTAASLEATLAIITDPSKRLAKVPGFASGGMFGGGLRLVGENGPELEVTGPARIFSASQTQALLAGGEGNAALLAELQALRQEVAQLRQDQQYQAAAIAGNTGKAARILERVTPDGASLQVVTAP